MARRRGRLLRVLVGMERLAEDELRAAFRLAGGVEGMDNATALRLKQRAAAAFREQLAVGAPTAADELAVADPPHDKIPADHT